MKHFCLAICLAIDVNINDLKRANCAFYSFKSLRGRKVLTHHKKYKPISIQYADSFCAVVICQMKEGVMFGVIICIKDGDLFIYFKLQQHDRMSYGQEFQTNKGM